MTFKAPQSVFKMLNFLERAAAYAQGKGYGTATIEKEVSLVLSFLKNRASLAIDIGGNVGDYTAELRRTNPKLEIHTFEPSTENTKKLNARFKADSLITLIPFAVSSEAGSATLFSNEAGSGLGSLTRRRLDHFDIAFDVSEAIRTIRFEDYWQNQLQRRPLDIVKIDVEGHELAVLTGIGEALNATGVLQFEFGGCNIDTRTYFQDFWYFFKEAEFDLYRITPLGSQKVLNYSESDEIFATSNYLAVNRRQISGGA